MYYNRVGGIIHIWKINTLFGIRPCSKEHMMLISNRSSVIVIMSRIKGINCIHFTDTVLSGANNDLWIPVSETEYFELIENLLVINNIANNVVRIDVKLIGDTFKDFEVIFNVK